jgi:DNA-binding CsgD family transcriptional regulator
LDHRQVARGEVQVQVGHVAVDLEPVRRLAERRWVDARAGHDDHPQIGNPPLGRREAGDDPLQQVDADARAADGDDADLLDTARARSAVGALPFVLALLARDQATTDRWAVAESTYREAIALARESDQRTDLGFGLAGLAWLQARQGRDETRALAAEALEVSVPLGARLFEVWAAAALGELELGLGDAAHAADHFERQRRLLRELGITDADLSPAPELVDAYIRLGRGNDAELVCAQFTAAARAKGQPWSLARALRCRGLLANESDSLSEPFEQALLYHAQTPDAFETARTRLAYGQRLRRARNRVLARDQLRVALDVFERLGAEPWAERARTELAATGETLRRRDPTTVDELTPQELQIGLLLAAGKTTREAAAALFLSPKTIEYHLRHVYQKLDIHSREELTQVLAASSSASEPADVEGGSVAEIRR